MGLLALSNTQPAGLVNRVCPVFRYSQSSLFKVFRYETIFSNYHVEMHIEFGSRAVGVGFASGSVYGYYVNIVNSTLN